MNPADSRGDSCLSSITSAIGVWGHELFKQQAHQADLAEIGVAMPPRMLPSVLAVWPPSIIKSPGRAVTPL